MKQLVIDISEDMAAELMKWSAQRGISREEVVLEMMREELAAWKLRKPGPPSLRDGGARGEPRR